MPSHKVEVTWASVREANGVPNHVLPKYVDRNTVVFEWVDKFILYGFHSGWYEFSSSSQCSKIVDAVRLAIGHSIQYEQSAKIVYKGKTVMIFNPGGKLCISS